jgi:serine/threonine-protein kinase
MYVEPKVVAVAVAGRYAIEDTLGRGGTTTVFLGREAGGRARVAVKVLHPELATAVAKRRFHREVEFLRTLSHPNILPVLLSEEAGPLLYYVTPYAGGGSLAALLAAGGRLPLDQTITIVRDVAAALDHAHAHNVLHRDVKPANILFDAERVMVCDFGIARAIEAAGEESSSGIVVGTPAYMSPEQARGQSPLGPASDIYALGCVAFEMLAGQAAFTGPTVQAIVARQAQQAPPRLSIVRPDLPAHVESAILQALAKEPGDRPSSAGEFARRLAGP